MTIGVFARHAALRINRHRHVRDAVREGRGGGPTRISHRDRNPARASTLGTVAVMAVGDTTATFVSGVFLDAAPLLPLTKSVPSMVIAPPASRTFVRLHRRHRRRRDVA